jgi:hypothetical protein
MTKLTSSDAEPSTMSNESKAFKTKGNSRSSPSTASSLSSSSTISSNQQKSKKVKSEKKINYDSDDSSENKK